MFNVSIDKLNELYSTIRRNTEPGTEVRLAAIGWLNEVHDSFDHVMPDECSRCSDLYFDPEFESL